MCVFLFVKLSSIKLHWPLIGFYKDIVRLFSMLFQTTIPVLMISSNAVTTGAFPKSGFAMEQMTAVTVKMKPTPHALVC